MQKQNLETPGRSGVIINMTSVNGLTAIPNIAGYNASKGGVTNLTRYSTRLVPHIEAYWCHVEDCWTTSTEICLTFDLKAL